MTTSAQVLVLNKAWQPVAFATVSRAFGLLVTGAAKALDSQYQAFDYASWAELRADTATDDVIHTVRYALKVPRVLVLQGYDKLPRKKLRFSRGNIYVRDGFQCQYCSHVFPRTQLNLDHVIPRCQGGKTSWTNVVCSCLSCNRKKGGRTPEQAGMALLRLPTRPTWSDLKPRSCAPYSEWLPFLDPASAAYWNAELED